MYCLYWLMTWMALADPVADLAPGPRELAEAQAELELRLTAAEAIERAVARLQSAYASTPALDETCRDPLRGPITLRLRLFASAWHDAAQRVRVQAKRVEIVSRSPTVTPIVDTERRQLLDGLLARALEQENGWLELVAWVGKHLTDRCDELELTAMNGLPDPIIRAQGEKQGPAAIIALTPGYVCAQGTAEGLAADNRVLIVSGPVCWSSTSACGCKHRPVNPAAVLGPDGEEPAPAPAPVPAAPEPAPSL
jgi:hypothetical protein